MVQLLVSIDRSLQSLYYFAQLWNQRLQLGNGEYESFQNALIGFLLTLVICSFNIIGF